jgi:glycerophosphoryl diester phosphodiesterase
MGTMPENTLAGISAAIENGVDAIEVDVRATADGLPVLLHDSSLERTTGDQRELAEVTSDELSALQVLDPYDDAGPQSVPTLAEALVLIDGRCQLVIEVKQADIEQLIATTLREASATGWCWLWSFDLWIASAVSEALPGVPTSLLVGERGVALDGPESPLKVAHGAGFSGVSLHRSLVTPQAVAEAHGHGLNVYTWTVNDDAEIRRVRDAGVDGICGDYPLRVAEALRTA